MKNLIAGLILTLMFGGVAHATTCRTLDQKGCVDFLIFSALHKEGYPVFAGLGDRSPSQDQMQAWVNNLGPQTLRAYMQGHIEAFPQERSVIVMMWNVAKDVSDDDFASHILQAREEGGNVAGTVGVERVPAGQYAPPKFDKSVRDLGEPERVYRISGIMPGKSIQFPVELVKEDTYIIFCPEVKKDAPDPDVFPPGKDGHLDKMAATIDGRAIREVLKQGRNGIIVPIIAKQ